MRTGKNLVELATELQRRADVKQDFMAPTKKLSLTEENGKEILAVDGGGEFSITDHTHRQIGSWANIPAKYYDRMRGDAPALLQNNVNHWFKESDKNRMVRTLDGGARAFLSDRYRRIDNEDIAEQVLPVLLDSGNFAEVVSCEVTERKLYIKALFPKVAGEIRVGDEVQAGVSIMNSEIGLGSLNIQPLIHRLVCKNGMISQDHGLSRYHIGRKILGDGENAYALFQQETLKADDKALMMKIRDILKAASERVVFDAIVAKMREATQGVQVVNPVAAVEVMGKSIGFDEKEKTSVLEQLIRGQDYSKYGMLNAVTATANDHESYDRATDLESIGGKILDMPSKEWEVIAEAV